MNHYTQSAQISQKQNERNIYVIMKTMCRLRYHHNGFVATHALGHMMWGYTLLVPMNQRVLNRLSKRHNISGHKWSTTHSAQISQEQDEHNIYVIMKTMCPLSYHYSGLVAIHALGHMLYGYTLLVPMNQRVLNKLSKEHNISSHKWSTTHRLLKSRKSKMSIIYMLSWKQCVVCIYVCR